MRPLDTKYAWVSALVVLMLAGFSVQSRASHITASPDTVRATTPNVYYISVSDGRDTSQKPHTPLTSAHLYISGSADWTIFSDTLLSFFGQTYVVVEYKPQSSSPSSATLAIAGDSNTAVVALLGNPPTHSNLVLLRGANFLRQRPGHDTCRSIVVYNPNGFAVSLTSLTFTQTGVEYSVSNAPALPMSFGSHDSLQLTVCFLDSAVTDSEAYSATLHMNYSFSGGSDTYSYLINGSIIPYDTTCLDINSTVVGTAAPGGTVSRTFTLTNHTAASVTIDSAWILGGNIIGAFSITSPAFPVTIASNSTQSVTVQFAPPTSAAEGNYYRDFVFWDRGTSNDKLPCGEFKVSLTGRVLVPVVDTTYLNVPADSSTTISMIAKTRVSRHAFIIHNASSSRILVTTLGITSGDSIASFDNYGSTAQVYDTINAGGYSNMIIMKIDASDTGSYNIGLLLDYYNSLLAQTYTVKVHRTTANATASVHSTGRLAPSEFAMNPNPAQGSVVISLPTEGTSTLEIFDVLGNLLLSKQASGKFEWDGTSTGSSAPASGSYIVRVTQRETDGTTKSSSKRLILVR